MKRRSFTKIAKNIIFLCLIVLFMIEPLTTVKAAPGSWVEGLNPGAIKSPGGELSSAKVNIWDKSVVQYKVGTYNGVKPDGTPDMTWSNEEISWINAIMGRIFASPGQGIEYALGMANISIQSIMFGKAADGDPIDLNGGSISAGNLFQFSLDDGNPYGYIGATVYAVLRTIVCLFIAVMVMYQLAKAGVTVTGQDKSMMKESVYSAVIILAMLFFMPNIIDILVYLKDVILVTVSGMLPEGVSMDIVGSFWVAFLCESGFLNGLMYSASVIFMLYLMFLYIGNAIALACLFAFFPFVAFLSMSDKGTFMNWFKQFLGTVMVPVIDGILLLIPAYLMKLAGGSFISALISFIACLFIVPARKAVREALGLGGAGWGEGAGLSAFRMAKATAGAAVAKAASGIKDAALEAHDKNKQDRMEEEDAAREAATHDDLARNEHGLKDTNVNTDNMKPNSQKEGEKDNSKLDKFEKQGEGAEKEQRQQGKNDEQLINGGQADINDKTKNPLDEDKGARTEGEDEAIRNPQGDVQSMEEPPYGANVDGQASDASTSPANNAEYLGNDADRMANLENIDRLQEQKDAESARYEGLVNEENALKNANEAESRLDEAQKNFDAVDRNPNSTEEQKEQAGAELERATNEYNKALDALPPGLETREARNGRSDKIQDEKNGITNNLRDLNTIQNNAMQREARYASMDKLTGGSGERFSGAQEMAMRRSQEQVLRAHANHRNFDSKEMSGVLSNADKAKFYRERAQAHKHQVAKNNLTAAGKGLSAVGGAAVGALAEGSAMALNSMTGAEEAYASAQIAGSVADSTWTVGTTAAVEAVQSAKHAFNPVVRDARTLGKAEARASSAREFANKVRAQEQHIQSYNQRKAEASGMGQVVVMADQARTVASYQLSKATAEIKSYNPSNSNEVAHIYHDSTDQNLSNAARSAEASAIKAERDVERKEIVVENRRDRRGDTYNPTINVKSPTETRPVKAYNPTAYKSIVSESHERPNNIDDSSRPLPDLPNDQLEVEQQAIQRARAKKEYDDKKRKDDYSDPIFTDDDYDDDYNG